jgi:hypothetical protein
MSWRCAVEVVAEAAAERADMKKDQEKSSAG